MIVAGTSDPAPGAIAAGEDEVPAVDRPLLCDLRRPALNRANRYPPLGN